MNGTLLPPPPPPPLSFSPAPPSTSAAETTTSNASATRRSTRACDACRRRKVRCNGVAPRCQQCAHLDITCMYSSTGSSRRSRKSAAPRGTVIAACRNGSFTSTSSSTSTPPLPLSRFTPLSPGQGAPHVAHSPSGHTHVSDTSSPGLWSPVAAMRTPLFSAKNLTPQFFLDLMPEYLMMVYPVNPIMPEWEIKDMILGGYQDPETIAFLYSYAAVTVNLSSVDRPDRKDQVSSLLHASMESCPRITHLDPPPSAVRIVTHIFIEISLSGLNRADVAMIYLREAIGMVLVRRIHHPEVMAKVEPLERSRLERLYWECFIHERFYAVSGDKDILLDPLPTMPEWDATQPYSSWEIHYGWLCTIQTFSLVDKDFIMYWLRRHTPPPEWVHKRHRELEDKRWGEQIQSLLPMSQADLIVTRHWLRTSLWQIAIRNMILSSGGNDDTIAAEAPSLTLPLQLSQELKPFLESFSLEEVAVHGTGVVFKLFEITNAIIDVITQLPQASNADKRKRLEDLLTLKDLILRFSRIEGMHRRILEQKFEKVRKLHAEACAEDETLQSLVELL